MLVRALAVLLLLASGLRAQPAAIFSQVDEMLAALTEITGWEVKRAVPREVLSRAEFAKMVEEGVQEAERDKDVRAAELTLKMFGLAPWDFNLARESGDLVAEQAAAFYDFDKKRLFLLDNIPEGNEQRIALVHELAHALADQHHPLKKFMEKAKTDDATLARQSVVEGQASWLSWAYIALRANGRPEVPQALVNELAGAVGAGGDDFPVLARVPLYVRESLVFPYSEGLRFQDAVFRVQGRDAFDAVFRNPPASTQVVMRPQGYGSSPPPAEPELPKLDRVLGRTQAREFKKLADGDIGEFDFSVLLRQYGEETGAVQAASHWRGGSYAIYEHKRAKRPLLAHASEWDSPEAAQAFFRLYLGVLRGKWERIVVDFQSPTELRGSGDTGGFLLRLSGVHVQAVEGFSASPQSAE